MNGSFGIADCGFGIADWGLSSTSDTALVANPQSQIRNPQSAYPFRKPLFFSTSTNSWTDAADF